MAATNCEIAQLILTNFPAVLFNIVAMEKGAEFVAQLEVLVGTFVGKIVCQSIIKKQLLNLDKDKVDLTVNDCKTLIQNIQKAVSLFVTEDEAGRLQSEMDKLFTMYFP
jgi:hypothetical protein